MGVCVRTVKLCVEGFVGCWHTSVVCGGVLLAVGIHQLWVEGFVGWWHTSVRSCTACSVYVCTITPARFIRNWFV